MMFKPTHRAPAPWFKSTTRPQDITLAIIITIMSLTICNKVGEKMPSTTFINDAQKCSKNIITCKELSEDLPAVRITPTFINDAYKCNKDIITCKELGENLPLASIIPTFINDAHKCNNNIVICKMLDPNQSIMNEQKFR